MADVFVSIDWLNGHLDDQRLAVVDVRQPFFYRQAHIPGAVTLPLISISSPDGGPPAADTLAHLLGQAGISRDTHIVTYDEGGSHTATRLYWVLTLYGHPQVSVLDGGVTAWRHAGYDWAYDPTPVSPTDYPVPVMAEGLLTTTDALKASLDNRQHVIVDTRTPSEYLGVRPTAARDGHIPGAINVDWTANLRVDDGIAVTEDPERLRSLYREAGVTPDEQVTVYCASGMRASYTFAVLKSLGYSNVDLYLPGWNEWGNRSDTPVEGE
jgi:thiosulfate/3-mercaptopyruvate sulfurtransferase